MFSKMLQTKFEKIKPKPLKITTHSTNSEHKLSWDLLVQSQQWKQSNNTQNLFKVINKGTRMPNPLVK